VTLYLPSSFQELDQKILIALIERFPFATVVTASAREPVISHLPLLVRHDGSRLVLVGHFAAANAHWKSFEEGDTTAVFHGPHGYISPTWYQSGPAVPTWNYAVVHATGTGRLRQDDEFKRGVLRELTIRHESDRDGAWDPAQLPENLHHNLLGAIVAFELPVDRLEGKLKLGQNRAAADRLGAAARLELEGGGMGRELAAMMRATIE
jgi:transcriptional regulator